MSLIKIENQTEYTFIINSLKITLNGRDTTSGRSYATIDDSNLSNSELSELINAGYVSVGSVDKVAKVKGRKTSNMPKRKYTRRAPKNPEAVPYEKNSEVVVTTRDGGVERKRMVGDATGKEPIFVEGFKPDQDDSNDAFIDKKESKPKSKTKSKSKVKSDDSDDSFIEI